MLLIRSTFFHQSYLTETIYVEAEETQASRLNPVSKQTGVRNYDAGVSRNRTTALARISKINVTLMLRTGSNLSCSQIGNGHKWVSEN
jgi:hypothetical protein